MPETDKILEAEQNIQDLTKELNKLHTSAKMLQGAQEQVDAVLSSSNRVVELTGSFTKKTGQLISSLSEINFDNSFQEILDSINQLAGSLEQLEMKLLAMEKKTKKWQILTFIFIALTLLISIILFLG